ncbi:GGDEF domain-containing protein [Brevirhabdus sp.]|uniref:GGDEF domain-containing protein n=1 Tax=Brevirhabdus sp. TaxID=2004514 RepID=UPI0040581F38
MTGAAGHTVLPDSAIDRLMPLHLRVGGDGLVRRAGPTLAKLCRARCLVGAPFSAAIRLHRPFPAADRLGLGHLDGRQVRLSLSCRPDVTLNGTAAALDLALSVTGIEAVGRIGLTLTDFAVTDQTADLLYLQEINAHILEEWRALSGRLDTARRLAERRAGTDSLTGLGNRRSLRELLARLSGEGDTAAFGLMHIDLDHFKRINDRFGHGAGDKVLRRVARILREQTRQGDFVARSGGDEFTVVLRDCADQTVLRATAERILRALACETLAEQVDAESGAEAEEGAGASGPALMAGTPEVEPQPDDVHPQDQRSAPDCAPAHGPVMASIGMTLSTEYARIDPAAMLKDADRALYRAKAAGRGRHSAHHRRGAAMR